MPGNYIQVVFQPSEIAPKIAPKGCAKVCLHPSLNNCKTAMGYLKSIEKAGEFLCGLLSDTCNWECATDILLSSKVPCLW